MAASHRNNGGIDQMDFVHSDLYRPVLPSYTYSTSVQVLTF